MLPYPQRCISCAKGSNRHLVLPLNKKSRMKGTYRTIVLPSEVHFSYEGNIKRSNTTFVCKILNRGTIGRSNVAIKEKNHRKGNIEYPIFMIFWKTPEQFIKRSAISQ